MELQSVRTNNLGLNICKSQVKTGERNEDL